MDIRSFIALPLSEEMAASFFEVAETLCNIEHFQQIRWLPPQNCHMTLAFLGNVEEERLESLARILGQSLAEITMGILRFNEVSPFPFNARPRVIAALAETSEWLKTLQSSCRQAARKAGIVLEGRRLVPHVTLDCMNGRRRNSPELPPLFIETQIPVKQVVLYESILHSEGAQYHVIESFDLMTAETLQSS